MAETGSAKAAASMVFARICFIRFLRFAGFRLSSIPGPCSGSGTGCLGASYACPPGVHKPELLMSGMSLSHTRLLIGARRAGPTPLGRCSQTRDLRTTCLLQSLWQSSRREVLERAPSRPADTTIGERHDQD